MPPQHVFLFVLLFVVCLNHGSTTPTNSEHPRKLLQSRWVQSLNTSLGLVNSDKMATKASTQALDQSPHTAAYISNRAPETGYTGAMATFDVFGFPNLHKGEVSSARVMVDNRIDGHPSSINQIMFGWEVNPESYEDSKTHFFVYWEDDTTEGGCYNLYCSGFVPVNGAPITPGDALELPNGQTKITLKIFRSSEDGDWWLYYGTDANSLSRVGFWPHGNFGTLKDHATTVAWGGFTMSLKGRPSPPMGNGVWPHEKWAEKQAASLQNVQFVDTGGHAYDATWPEGLRTAVTHGNCYKVTSFVDNMFYYGGPGGCRD